MSSVGASPGVGDVYSERLVQWIDAKISVRLFDECANVYKEKADRLLLQQKQQQQPGGGGGGGSSAAAADVTVVTVAQHSKTSLIAFLNELKQGSKSEFCQRMYEAIAMNDKMLHTIVTEAVEHMSRRCFASKCGPAAAFPVDEFRLKSPRQWFDKLIEILFRRLEFYPGIMNQYNTSSESKMNNLAVGMRLITECIRDSVLATVKLDHLILGCAFASPADLCAGVRGGGGSGGRDSKQQQQYQQDIAQLQAAAMSEMDKIRRESKRELDMLRQQRLQQSTTEQLLMGQVAELQRALEDQKEQMLAYQEQQEADYQRQQQALMRSDQQLRIARIVSKPALPKQRMPITQHSLRFAQDEDEEDDDEEDAAGGGDQQQDDDASDDGTTVDVAPARAPARRQQQQQPTAARGQGPRAQQYRQQDTGLRELKQKYQQQQQPPPPHSGRPKPTLPQDAKHGPPPPAPPPPATSRQHQVPTRTRPAPPRQPLSQPQQARASVSDSIADVGDDEVDLASQASGASQSSVGTTSTTATSASAGSGSSSGGSGQGKPAAAAVAATTHARQQQQQQVASMPRSATATATATGGSLDALDTASLLSGQSGDEDEADSVVSRSPPVGFGQLQQRPIQSLDRPSGADASGAGNTGAASETASASSASVAAGSTSAAHAPASSAGSTKNLFLPVPTPVAGGSN